MEGGEGNARTSHEVYTGFIVEGVGWGRVIHHLFDFVSVHPTHSKR